MHDVLQRKERCYPEKKCLTLNYLGCLHSQYVLLWKYSSFILCILIVLVCFYYSCYNLVLITCVIVYQYLSSFLCFFIVHVSLLSWSIPHHLIVKVLCSFIFYVYDPLQTPADRYTPWGARGIRTTYVQVGSDSTSSMACAYYINKT